MIPTTKTIKLSDLKPNTNNPRFIRDEKFQKLVKSIQEFPQMLELRPIVVDADYTILRRQHEIHGLQRFTNQRSASYHCR
jgi:hypothetical protein